MVARYGRSTASCRPICSTRGRTRCQTCSSRRKTTRPTRGCFAMQPTNELWAAWALALRGEAMDLARLRRLLDREELLKALDPYRRDPRVAEWVQRLEHHT